MTIQQIKTNSRLDEPSTLIKLEVAARSAFTGEKFLTAEQAFTLLEETLKNSGKDIGIDSLKRFGSRTASLKELYLNPTVSDEDVKTRLKENITVNTEMKGDKRIAIDAIAKAIKYNDTSESRKDLKETFSAYREDLFDGHLAELVTRVTNKLLKNKTISLSKLEEEIQRTVSKPTNFFNTNNDVARSINIFTTDEQNSIVGAYNKAFDNLKEEILNTNSKTR